MHVTIVQVRVKPEHVDAFISATRGNHLGSVQEPGNLRFDFLQSPDDPLRFILYEAYVSADHAAVHKETNHYKVWRETVADWMAEPRQGEQFNGLLPQTGSDS